MATTSKENEIAVFLAWQIDLDKKFARSHSQWVVSGDNR
jgi:hypothetical protein